MAWDWKKLAQDKRVWAGAAVVAAVAVVAVVRNRGAAGGDAPVGSGANPVGSGGTAGYYQATGDTTGSNLASFLGSWGQANLDAQQQGFKSILDALQGSAADTTTTTYRGGENFQSWLNSINAQNVGLNLTMDKFRALNPGVEIKKADAYGFIDEGTRRGGTVSEVFYTPSGTVRLK